MKIKGLSIRLKALLLMLGLALAALTAYMGIAIDLFNKDKRSYVFEGSAIVAEMLSTETRSYFQKSMDLARLVSAQIRLTPGSGPGRIDKDAISAILRTHAEVVELRVALRNTPQKDLVFSSFDAQFVESNHLTKDFFEVIERESPTIPPQDESDLSLTNVSRSGLAPLLRLSLLTRSQSSLGRPDLLTTLILETRTLSKLFAQNTAFTASLIDNSGQILAHQNPERAVARDRTPWTGVYREIQSSPVTNQTRELTSIKNETVIGSFNKVGIDGLTVVTEIPREKAFLASAILVQHTLYFGLMILGLAILASLSFSRRLTSSIAQLYEAIKKISKGDFKTTVKLNTRDEIGFLSDAFNNMVIDLALQFEETKRVTAEKQHVRDTFSRYLAPAVVDEALENPDNIRLGGERKDITMLFADVRDFTSISEHLPPEKLSDCLNRYLNRMTDTIFDTGGTLDKYIGDAIVAFWGAPLPLDNHAAHSIQAAIAMRTALPEINREFKNLGYPEFRIGIGINSGDVNIGNMGSQRIMAYTALGDNMNLACRIESLCKYYQADILVTEFTIQSLGNRAKEFNFRPIDFAQVKGKSIPVTIYEVIHPLHPLAKYPSVLETYQQGYASLSQMKLTEASKLFQEVLKKMPADVQSKRLLVRISDMNSKDPKSRITVHDHK